jgi:hypothetical protein
MKLSRTLIAALLILCVSPVVAPLSAYPPGVALPPTIVTSIPVPTAPVDHGPIPAPPQITSISGSSAPELGGPGPPSLVTGNGGSILLRLLALYLGTGIFGYVFP